MSLYSKRTQKGTRWYYQFYKGGKAYRGGGYRTRTEAGLAEADRRRTPDPDLSITFKELYTDYLNYAKRRGQSEHERYEKRLFFEKIGWDAVPIDLVTSKMIEDLMFRRADEASNYMGNKALKFLKSLFNYACHPKQALLQTNPCDVVEKLPVEHKLKSLPDLEDLMAVREIAEEMDKALLDLLLLTSARIGELLNLKWKDYQGTHLVLKTRKHKGGAIREDVVSLSPAGRAILESLKARVGSKLNLESYIFVNPRTGTRYLRMPKRMKSLCKKAGVKPFGFHVIRALSASIMAEGGVPLTTIQERLRHQRSTTTDLYLKGLPHGDSRAEETLDRVVRARESLMKLFLSRRPESEEKPAISPFDLALYKISR